MPSLIVNAFFTVAMIATNTMDSLIVFTSYASILGSALAVCALIYLRFKESMKSKSERAEEENTVKPGETKHRRLRLPIIIPILFLLCFIVVLVLPFTNPNRRFAIAISFVIIASGIPVYFIFVRPQHRVNNGAGIGPKHPQPSLQNLLTKSALKWVFFFSSLW